jgi:hypothetical protein
MNGLAPAQRDGIGLDAIPEQHKLVRGHGQSQGFAIRQHAFGARGPGGRRWPRLADEPGEPGLGRAGQRDSAVPLCPASRPRRGPGPGPTRSHRRIAQPADEVRPHDQVLTSATLVRKPAVQLIASSAWRRSPGHGVGCGDGAPGSIARWAGFAAAPRLAGPGRRSSLAGPPKATTALMSELWPWLIRLAWQDPCYSFPPERRGRTVCVVVTG